MGDNLSFKEKEKNPTAELRAAIHTLDKFNHNFNRRNEFSKQSIFATFMKLVADKFSENSSHLFKREHDELINAVSILKRNFVLIHKLEEGSPQEQTLASFARAVINNFNATIEKINEQTDLSLKERIASYLMNSKVLVKDIEKIELPRQSSVPIDFSKKERETFKKISPTINSPYIAAASLKISKLPQIHSSSTPFTKSEYPHLSRQAIQLFYMKIIALIEKHDFLSHLEARRVARKASLQISIDSEHYQPPLCIVTSTLSPFAGQYVTVTGAFEKDPNSPLYTIPCKEIPFQREIAAKHKGFPHPSQNAGWALPDMVPEDLQRLEESFFFKSLNQEKQNTAEALSPNQPILDKAKYLHSLKMEVFDGSKEEFIDLHQTLASEIVRHSPSKNESIEPILLYFNRLKQIHHSYDYLSETYQIINDMFYKRLLDMLQRAWNECLIPYNTEQDPENSVKACKNLMDIEFAKILQELNNQRQAAASPFEKETVDFIVLMGKIFQPWQEVILQQLSETILFHPPKLSDFSKKIQTVCYRQLLSFIKEMEIEISEDREVNAAFIHQTLKEYLRQDIALFKTGSFEDLASASHAAKIVLELENYYLAPFSNP